MSRVKRDLGRFRKDLHELLEESVPAGSQEGVFQEMLMNLAQLRQEKLDYSELRLLNTAFKELRYALSVFKPYRHVPKAAVFGSARTARNHPDWRMAENFGRRLAKKEWMVITGAASGIMEAAMTGAGSKNSFGLNILLPFEQQPNAVIRGNKKLMFFKYFFTRKLMFLKESQATVLFPGGFGTFDEGFESFTLVQTGKARPRPIVLLDTPGSRYWKSCFKFLSNHMERRALISRSDLSLLRHFQDAASGVKELTHFFSNYDSSRFWKDQYLIRLRKPLSDGTLRELSARFKDIFTRGGFERLEASEDDGENPLFLERIVFHFDRSSYSRLRQLIDVFNSL